MTAKMHPIKTFRIRAKKTKREMAASLGVTEVAYGLWERGFSVPNGTNLVHLLELFRKELKQPNLQASELLS